MAIPERVKTKMKEEGLTKVNVPKRTPKHKTKSHCVMAKEGDTYKFIRFGQQGCQRSTGLIKLNGKGLTNGTYRRNERTDCKGFRC